MVVLFFVVASTITLKNAPTTTLLGFCEIGFEEGGNVLGTKITLGINSTTVKKQFGGTSKTRRCCAELSGITMHVSLQTLFAPP